VGSNALLEPKHAGLKCDSSSLRGVKVDPGVLLEPKHAGIGLTTGAHKE